MQARGRGRGWKQLLPSGLMTSSLLRNGYALIANSGLTAILGLAFWFLAARYSTPEAIGLGGAITATIVNLSNAAQLNFGNFLVRFVPTIGKRAGRLILFAYSVSVAASILVAVVFLFVVGAFMPKLEVLTQSAGVMAWFVVTVAIWSVFALQDSALSGLRQSIWVPISKTTYQFIKISLLVPLTLFGLGWEAIALSWTAPVVLFVLAVNLLIFKRLVPATEDAPDYEHLIHRQSMARYFGWDYIGAVSMMVAWTATPLVVLNLVGAAESASFFVAWTIFTSLYYVGSSMGLSLLAEGASNGGRLRSLAADAAVMSVLPLLGLVTLMVIFAHPIMSVFGETYADEGAAILRIFAIASVVSAVLSIYLSIARTKGWMRSVAMAEFSVMALALVSGVFLVRHEGPIGMAEAWLLAMLTVACGVGVFALVTGRRDSVYDWALAVAAASKRLSAQFLPWGRPQTPLPIEADLAPLLLLTARPDAPGWRPHGAEPGPDGTVTVYLADHAGDVSGYQNETRAVLRRARDLVAITYIERQIDNLDLMQAEPRLRDFLPLLPSRLAVRRTKGAIDCVEAAIGGESGVGLLRHPVQLQAGLTEAAGAIALLHGRTSAPQAIGEGWFREWIEWPAAQLRNLNGSLISQVRREAALDLFVQRQRSYWCGRELRLGWCHGDLQPRNLRFSGVGGDAFRLAGILEWGKARPNAPDGYDACGLAIALRAISSGEPLGAVVADLLWLPEWNPEEKAWLAVSSGDDRGWSDDAIATRALVGLVWLQQVSERIRRPEGTGRLWIAANVDRVLRIVSSEGGAL
ncbi:MULTISPECIES: phosphotransferase [unclassified Ensifer]|uniref:phosphotransferase n=1 Tax=unclassified Ensifer TaxID=2633371 RepID=UPI00301018B5